MAKERKKRDGRKFTDLGIRAIKPESERYEIRDLGAEGLYVAVQPSGHKGFVVRYRFKGQPRKLSLGGKISLAAARKEATAAFFEAKQGRDPTASKRTAKQHQKVIEATTFEVIAEQYLKIVCGKKLGSDGKPIFNDEVKTAARLDAELKRLVYPTLGDRPISEIRRSEVVALLDKIQTGELKFKDGDGKSIKGGPVVADRTLALIRTIFNWHAKRADVFRSPLVAGMERTKTKERARDRKLTDDEICKAWSASAEGTFPLFVRFLLLTGARRSEASAMTWDEIKDDDWTLPADAGIGRNKVGVDLVRPLSDAALAVIEKLRRLRRDDGCRYLFSTNGKPPINAFGRLKRAFDKQTGTTGWTLHDLRRSARSLMSRAGINSDHAERCLGHTIGGARGTYDRHEFYEEKKRAYDALAALIERIATPPEGSNVTTLKRRA
jgi:integrase